MRVCVFGAGAIGGYMAALIAEKGHEVSVVARGQHLRAIRASGIRLVLQDRTIQVKVAASDDPQILGQQDIVVCALKAHQAWENAERFAPLLGAETPVLTAMNGFPWWHFYGDEMRSGIHLKSVDEGGRQWRCIGPQRAIGCVVEPACEVIEPGVILHRTYNRFQIGEPDGSVSDRVKRLADLLVEAGMSAPIRTDIRNHVWLKLFGNACFNPISLLTLSTIDRITTHPPLRKLCRNVMEEVSAVANGLDVDVPPAMIERRLDAASRMVGHKMSMLQDLERGRSLELDALVEAVVEAARIVNVPTPFLDAVLALAREREWTLQQV
jgi:2-dehydropantoate 2-reductase